MKSSLFAAGWGPFIPFAIFFFFTALSLLHATWKRSQRSNQKDGGSWGGPVQPPEEWSENERRSVVGRYVRPTQTPTPMPTPVLSQPRPLSPWEQELERVLGRDLQPIPVPPVVQPAPLPSPVQVRERWLHPPAEETVEELTAENPESAPMPTAPLASLASADSAYGSAASLQDRVHAFMHAVDTRVDRHVVVATPRRSAMSAEMAAFVAGFRQPDSARQAILASLVLGPPKAFEA